MMQRFGRLGCLYGDKAAFRLLPTRSFSSIKEISAIQSPNSNTNTTENSKNPEFNDTRNIKNTNNNCQTRMTNNRDFLKNESDFGNSDLNNNNNNNNYDSRMIDEKLRACPHLPANKMQKDVFGIYADALGRTQASYMSNYELICRGQYDGPIRETKEYHYLHLVDTSKNENLKNTTTTTSGQPFGGKSVTFSRELHERHGLGTTTTTTNTSNNNIDFDTSFSTIDINEILSNGNGINDIDYEEIYDTTLTKTLGKSVDVIDKQYNEYKLKIDQSGKIPIPNISQNEEINITTELSNCQNYEMRNDIKWRKHKMKKHRRKKRLDALRLKRRPGNTKSKDKNKE